LGDYDEFPTAAAFGNTLVAVARKIGRDALPVPGLPRVQGQTPVPPALGKETLAG